MLYYQDIYKDIMSQELPRSRNTENDLMNPEPNIPDRLGITGQPELPFTIINLWHDGLDKAVAKIEAARQKKWKRQAELKALGGDYHRHSQAEANIISTGPDLDGLEPQKTEREILLKAHILWEVGVNKTIVVDTPQGIRHLSIIHGSPNEKGEFKPQVIIYPKEFIDNPKVDPIITLFIDGNDPVSPIFNKVIDNRTGKESQLSQLDLRDKTYTREGLLQHQNALLEEVMNVLDAGLESVVTLQEKAHPLFHMMEQVKGNLDTTVTYKNGANFSICTHNYLGGGYTLSVRPVEVQTEIRPFMIYTLPEDNGKERARLNRISFLDYPDSKNPDSYTWASSNREVALFTINDPERLSRIQLGMELLKQHLAILQPDEEPLAN